MMFILRLLSVVKGPNPLRGSAVHISTSKHVIPTAKPPRRASLKAQASVPMST